MDLQSYRNLIRSITYGKQLPGAVYVFRPQQKDLSPPFWNIIRRAEVAGRPDVSWNLLKIHKGEVAFTFLTYPDFDDDPHPALAEATKINLRSGSVTRIDYRGRPNLPILHRKDTFLPPDDPRISAFAQLTKCEEDAGLYRNPSRIGLRLQWNTLLKKHNLTYEGHNLAHVQVTDRLEDEGTAPVEVRRHRTAIKRYDLSKPLKFILERGLLRKDETFFDYGCGHGMDIEALQNLGYNATGWDPAFRPTAPKTTAAVVNLGYVLNVIEDPQERVAALREAYSLAEKVLVVSTLVTGQKTDAHCRPYRDGFLTKTHTFQKFYVPGELENLLEDALDVEAVTLSMGICAAFRNQNELELYEAGRSRRRFDWSEINTQLRFAVPATREQRRATRYDLHKELFDKFWDVLLDIGRAPQPGEFEELVAIKKAAGGMNRAIALVTRYHDERLWQQARKARSEDVLVYLAMTRFRRRFRRREIPLRIKNDIRSFFGGFATGQAKANDLLLASADPDEIELACEGLDLGWQDQNALIIHRSLFAKLPPVLRIFILCAAHRYGDPEQADLIKLHKHSGKITFQHYDDFDGKSLPELQTRIKVNLRNLFVEVFDHFHGPKRQLLYFKERFVAKDHPDRPAFEKFSARLRKLGFDEATIGFGPDKQTFLDALAAAGLSENLRPIRKHNSPSDLNV